MAQVPSQNPVIKNVILFGTLGVIGYVLYKKFYVPSPPQPEASQGAYDPNAGMYAPVPMDQGIAAPAPAPLPVASRPTDMAPYTQSTDYLWNRMNLSDSVLAALRLSWLQSKDFYTAANMAVSGQGKIDYLNKAFDDFTIANYGNSTYTKVHPVLPPVNLNGMVTSTGTNDAMTTMRSRQPGSTINFRQSLVPTTVRAMQPVAG